MNSELTYPRVWLAAHWRHPILSSKCWNDRPQPSYLAFTQVLGIQILVFMCEVQSYLFRPDVPLDQALLPVGTSDSPENWLEPDALFPNFSWKISTGWGTKDSDCLACMRLGMKDGDCLACMRPRFNATAVKRTGRVRDRKREGETAR